MKAILAITVATTVLFGTVWIAVSLAQAPPVSRGDDARPAQGVTPLQKKAPRLKKRASKPARRSVAMPKVRHSNDQMSFRPHPDAQGDELKLQQWIASRFSRADPCPPQRIARYQPLMRDDWSSVGWHGTIRTVTPNDSGWLVTVRVSPVIASSRSILLMHGGVDEVYQCTPAGEFIYMKGEDSPVGAEGLVEEF